MGRTIRPLIAALTTFTLVAAACGGSDEAEAGGPGHWSAAQLCSLASTVEVSAVFARGDDVAGVPGLDNPDWSVCLWKDPDATGTLANPAPSLITVSNHSDTDTRPLSSSNDDPVALSGLGADDAAVYRAEWLDDTSWIAVYLGTERLEIEWIPEVHDARALVETMAQRWVDAQVGDV